MRIAVLAMITLLGAGCANTREPAADSSKENASLERQLATLLEWFPGEYDNHEQHWQQETVEKRAQPIEHIHHLFVPVDAPAIGAHTFFVKQYLDNDPRRIYRQRLYAFDTDSARDAVRLTIYSFKDEKTWADAFKDAARMAALAPSDLEARPGCEVYWRWNADHFVGSMVNDACRFVSQRTGGKEIIINDDLKLTAEEIWISDVARDPEGNLVFGNTEGVPHKNRKVRYFTAWAALKRGGKDAAPESRDWLGMRNIVLHNEGDRVPIVDDAGNRLGYSIELARLTYQNTTTPILKLGVIDDATGKTVAYSWSEPNGTRLGINIGWLQTGVTLKTERVHFRD
jgi:hypothetical protein